MEAADLEDLVIRAKQAGGYVNDAVRSDQLNVGVYVLHAGAVDSQRPHKEDEVYYVVRGRGQFHCGGEERSVAPGAILLVRADADHRFHDIEEELVLVVFWAPPHRD